MAQQKCINRRVGTESCVTQNSALGSRDSDVCRHPQDENFVLDWMHHPLRCNGAQNITFSFQLRRSSLALITYLLTRMHFPLSHGEMQDHELAHTSEFLCRICHVTPLLWEKSSACEWGGWPLYCQLSTVALLDGYLLVAALSCKPSWDDSRTQTPRAGILPSYCSPPPATCREHWGKISSSHV